MSKPIIVGYDPNRSDRAPVDFGAAVARFTGAPLIVACVQARSPVVPLSGGQSVWYAVVDDDLIADAAHVLQAIEAELSTFVGKVEGRLLRGTSAARALQAAAEDEDAGLLVVGSSRRSRPARLLAGSTAERLLHGAPCPVAIVPQNWTNGAPKTIGVAYVDSEEGREALRGAHALARRVPAALRAVTVVKPTLAMHSETEPRTAAQEGKDLEDVEGEHRFVAERSLRRAVAGLADGVPIEVEALVGDPAEVLVAISEHLDLLVCGSRGYGPLRAVLLGSVSRAVVSAAHCPVIVLPRGVKAPLEELLQAPGTATPA